MSGYCKGLELSQNGSFYQPLNRFQLIRIYCVSQFPVYAAYYFERFQNARIVRISDLVRIGWGLNSV